ncbi:MAG: Hpt domain-containing protein [Pseudooceanicola sp.]
MIDWTTLNALRDEVGHDGFAEVMELFLADLDTGAAALRPGPTLEAQLHFLKGAALTMGLTDLAALCQQGETAAARGASDGIDIGQVVDCLERSRARFLAEAPERLHPPAANGAA